MVDQDSSSRRRLYPHAVVPAFLPADEQQMLSA